jgi:hypothetical protein
MTRLVLAIAVLVFVAVAEPTCAAILCQKPSGAVVVREACRRREVTLDLSRFGGVGPQGPPGPAGVGPLTNCPPDSVLVGPTCVDKYEASTWQVDPTNTALVAKIKTGIVTIEDLTSGGATQLCGGPNHDEVPTNFPKSGQWTSLAGANPPSPGVYAVSVAGVVPTRCLSWFQAAQACRLSGKRLLTNLEWQDAAAGTPDPGTDNGTTDCAVGLEIGAVALTGSRPGCKSSWGTFDQVGSMGEWVADWADQANGCTDWTQGAGLFDLVPGNDSLCFGGAGDPGDVAGVRIPGALLRGGDFIAPGPAYAQYAGVFAVTSHTILAEGGAGYRCGR